MTPLAWMTGASVLSWAVASLVAWRSINPELLFGMIGPLASACITWVAVVRAQRAAPERVTRVLVAGFAVKMVYFGAYVAVMLRVVALRPVPFVVGFTSYLIGLYMMEALFLKRLTTIRQADH
jgi:hypothetical protein